MFGLLYLKKLDFQMIYQHGWDSAYFGTSTPANAPLPPGARTPTWNGGFVETHYVYNPQLIFIQRSEFIRMSNQALPLCSTGAPACVPSSSLGNIDAYTFGYRWYPIMHSRAGFAWHNEYSIVRRQGVAPVSGTSLTMTSLFAGFDIDF